MMISTVGELMAELMEYPSDKRIYYASKYALVDLDLKLLDDYLVLDMNDKSKDVLKFE